MDPRALRVVADDLTGACDIAAALLPWDGDVYVEAYAGGDAAARPGLWVRNTQSRTLPADVARATVAGAVAGGGRDLLVLKKIDTALRGHLGAELEAVMDAVGAEETFVLPAIPAVGRTTIDGVQLIDGVAVADTAFAADPLHPVRDSAVARHVERESARRCRTLALAEIRSRPRLEDAIMAGRRDGCTIFVCDAAVDDDLARALDVLLERPRPLVLAGSLGLGRALRRRLPLPSARPAAAPARRCGGGTLVVVGSMHPMARRQSDAVAGADAMYELSDREAAERTGERAAAAIARGGAAVLRTPAAIGPGGGAALLAAVARAVASCVAAARPGALVLVGGETAHAALRALSQPCIRVVDAVGPLIVAGELVGGALAGTPVVSKGGSAGVPDSLARAVAWLRGTGR